MNFDFERGCLCTLCLMRNTVEQDKREHDETVLYAAAQILATDDEASEGSEYTRGQIDLAVNLAGYADDGSAERETLAAMVRYERWRRSQRG